MPAAPAGALAGAAMEGVVVTPLAAFALAVIGADAGCGGWFDSAPGTPDAPLWVISVAVLDCWLRTAACSGLPFGP